MFDLKREVDAWSTRAFAGPCPGKVATLAELRDHLYCEVERLEKEGKSLEEAFRIASAKLGAMAAKAVDDDGARTLRHARLANAILWAALILAVAILLHDRAESDTVAYLLIGVQVPLWFTSDQLLVRYLRAAGRR